MKWTPAELIWLGTMAFGCVITIIAATADMRGTVWQSLTHWQRKIHKAGIVVVAAGLVAGVCMFWFLSIGGVR